MLLKNTSFKLVPKCQMFSTLYKRINNNNKPNIINYSILKQIPNRKKLILSCTSASSSTETSSNQKNELKQELPLISTLDIRVGFITSVKKHPDADSLYIETIEVGEEEPRTILSGLVPYLTPEELNQKRVIVLCNLKARNMRGIKSHGMILCASNKADLENETVVEPLIPPEEGKIGERIFFNDDDNLNAPETENKVQKKKIWEKLQPMLKTDSEGIAQFNGKSMKIKNGYIKSKTLKNAQIS